MSSAPGQKSDSWLGGESRKMDGPGGMLSPRNGRKTSAQGHPLDGWQRVSAFKHLFAEKVSRRGIETGILLSERPFRQKQEPFLAGKRRRVEPNDLNFRTKKPITEAGPGEAVALTLLWRIRSTRSIRWIRRAGIRRGVFDQISFSERAPLERHRSPSRLRSSVPAHWMRRDNPLPEPDCGDSR
jgi:hypothetical protein